MSNIFRASVPRQKVSAWESASIVESVASEVTLATMQFWGLSHMVLTVGTLRTLVGDTVGPTAVHLNRVFLVFDFFLVLARFPRMRAVLLALVTSVADSSSSELVTLPSLSLAVLVISEIILDIFAISFRIAEISLLESFPRGVEVGFLLWPGL